MAVRDGNLQGARHLELILRGIGTPSRASGLQDEGFKGQAQAIFSGYSGLGVRPGGSHGHTSLWRPPLTEARAGEELGGCCCSSCSDSDGDPAGHSDIRNAESWPGEGTTTSYERWWRQVPEPGRRNDQPFQTNECGGASWYWREQTELATKGSDEDEGEGPWQRKRQAEGAPIEDWNRACEFRREVAHLSLDEWRSLVADGLVQAQSAADLSRLLWRCFGRFCSTQANLIASTACVLEGRDVVPIPPCTLRMLPKAGHLKHATPLIASDVIAATSIITLG
eukprot:5897265-Amphidinium_carterae.1